MAGLGCACRRLLCVRRRRAHGAAVFRRSCYRAHDGGAAVPAGRLRVSDDKVRIETPELADGFFLIDGAKPSAYFVRPAARIFMDARQSSRLTRLFVPVDPDDPCRQWQAMAKLAGVAEQGDWRCERIGEETIGARQHRWLPGGPGLAAEEFLGWIDPARKFPLRIKTEDGAVITVENIRDEPQPAQSFEIPARLTGNSIRKRSSSRSSKAMCGLPNEQSKTTG